MSKLYCYSHSAFRDKLKAESWNDDTIPDTAAFICIGCTPDCQDYCGGMFSLHDNFDLKRFHENVLRVRFDDIDEETQVVTDSVFEDRTYKLKGIDDDTALKIVEFIERNIDKDFYIHCNAGKSRSQAVVRYILDVYRDRDWELNPANMNTTWNGFVYKKLIKANFG